MAKTYQPSWLRRFGNRIIMVMIRRGGGPDNMFILTVRGRKTGRAYSTPVSLVIDGDQRWLVSAYGEVSWVKNARAAGQVTLSRGGQSETVRITELGPDEAAPVLKLYLEREVSPRPYFDVTPASSLADFAIEAPRHPVFRIQ